MYEYIIHIGYSDVSYQFNNVMYDTNETTSLYRPGPFDLFFCFVSYSIDHLYRSLKYP